MGRELFAEWVRGRDAGEANVEHKTVEFRAGKATLCVDPTQ